MNYQQSVQVNNFNFESIYNYNPSSLHSHPSAPPLYPALQPHYYLNPYPAKPALTQAMHSQTLGLLAKASEMSSSILYGNVPNPPLPYAPMHIAPTKHQTAPAQTFNFDFSDKSWNMFNNETHVHHHHNGNGSEGKNDSGTRILVGIIGLVVAGAAAFFIGKAIAQGEDVEDESQSLNDLKCRWTINKVSYSADYQTSVETVITKMDAISERNQTNRTHKIALLVFTFIGGGTAIAGAIIGSTPLMLTAVAIGSCVTIATLFKLGYACFSNRDQKDAQSIEKHLTQIYATPLQVV